MARAGPAVEVAMPRLSDSMEEGTIVEWLAADGDAISRGQELVEIETDKARIVYEAPGSGLLRIIATAGVSVRVGDTIAYLDDPEAAGLAQPAPKPQAPASGEQPAPKPQAPSAGEQPAPKPQAPSAGEQRADDAPAGPEGAHTDISPVARRLAAKLGVDLQCVSPTGPGGRIVKEDVLRAAAGGPTPQRHAKHADEKAADAVRGDACGPLRRERPTRAQQLTARRVSLTRATVPDFAVCTEVDSTAAIALLGQLSGVFDPRPTLNDLVVAALGRTLRRHPNLNASYADDEFVFYEHVNVGIAVDASGELIVPVLARAHEKTLAEIAAESRRLVGRTRNGEITPQELTGGTFTVSNLGMFGVTSFRPIINAPQAAILAVGAAGSSRRDAHAPRRDATEMNLTLVSDHRIVYGAQAAAFLADLRAVFEQPLPLLLAP